MQASARGTTLESAADLLEYAQELAEDERAAVARELHEDLGGVLVAAKMQVVTLEQRLAGTPELIDLARKLRAALEAAIAMKQRLEERLHPGLLVHIGLFAALRSHADELLSTSGCSCDLQLPATEPPLTPRARIVLYRAAQGALAHLRSLTSAKTLRMAGTATGGLLEVRISAPGATAAESLTLDRGLQLLQRRMEYLGGSLGVALDTQGRPSINLRLPLRSQLEEPA